ncbi:MAG TPA: M14 family zinc carboxypeptidase [Microlunatus sp.]
MIALGLVAVLVFDTLPAEASRPAVISSRVIGHSVQGRPIRAWHLGQPGHGNKTVVLIAQMHGDEQKVANILTSLRDGHRIRGVNLWVVPRYNPDGHARRIRQNARGVDLNRNYPASWRRTTGYFNSGRKAASEPETRAMMAFLKRTDPDYLLSFHQPLHGVDTLNPYKKFSRKVANTLQLPRKRFSCNGGCHGTMTMWFNRKFDGKALTVEYGAHPSRKYLRGTVARRVLNIFDAHR